MNKLREQLIRHEGFELRPYKDSVGKLTIGVGRNLDDNGLTLTEVMYLLSNDIIRCGKELEDRLPYFTSLNGPRQDALINMCFNLGITRFMNFKKMLAAIKSNRFNDAGKEALDSRWSTQVGMRALEIAEQLRSGEYDIKTICT